MPWQVVELNADDIRYEIDALMIAEFFNEFYLAELPPGAAVYRFGIPGGGKKFYFNPGAVKIAERVIESYFSTECRKPDLTTLEQIVGIKK